MRLLAAAFTALALVAPARGDALQDAVRYLSAQQRSDGGFGSPGLTAWAVLGLRAAGAPTGAAADYLAAHEDELASATDVELGLLAERALGRDATRLVARLRGLQQASGAIGATLSSTFWGAIALRAAGLEVPGATVRAIVARQARSGGWSWYAGVAPDSNDTAAAIQALRAAGVSGAPIRRGLAYLRRLQGRDGGFALAPGRGSDAQSTAWAIQAFLAAGERPGRAAHTYLARLHRPDGSYRYSARSGATPVWVTAQVLAALSGKPFPFTSAA